MKQLKGLAAQGKGMIGVLLPDTTTSARYVTYDAPYLTQAFEAAGLDADQFKIDNAQGSASTMQTAGRGRHHRTARRVLLVDPLDSGTRRGDRVERRVQGREGHRLRPPRHGRPADRYYVSFDNVEVGKLIGQGEVDCIAAWNVKKPEHPGHGRRPDRQQREAVRAGLQRRARRRSFADGTYVKVGEPAGTWDPPTARDDVRAAVHRPPEHQRGGHAERRQRQRRHLGAAEGQDPAEDVPDHRSGRLAVGAAEHPQGLPVRHGLQADLPRGPGGGRRSPCTCGPASDAADRRW